jgi:hypothetical protein
MEKELTLMTPSLLPLIKGTPAEEILISEKLVSSGSVLIRSAKEAKIYGFIHD